MERDITPCENNSTSQTNSFVLLYETEIVSDRSACCLYEI